MNTLDIQVPPWNSTLMGCVRGAADFFGLDVSDAMIYGATGHAFLLHIHPELCPSGPYTWKRDGFIRLLHNLGLTFEHLGFYANGAPESRRLVESRMREEIGESRPCVMINLEWQLVYGFDEQAFALTQPWPKVAYPPSRLTAGTWDELGKEVHADFYALLRTPRSSARHAIAKALLAVAEMAHHPEPYVHPGYVLGLDAYTVWRNAIPQHGTSHGNWWNATVWSECRAKAGDFMREVYRLLDEPLADELAETYTNIGKALAQVADKTATPQAKIAALDYCHETERHAIAKLGRLASKMVLYA